MPIHADERFRTVSARRLCQLLAVTMVSCLPVIAQDNNTLVKHFDVNEQVVLEVDLSETDIVVQPGQEGVVKVYGSITSTSEHQGALDVANSGLLFERKGSLIRITSAPSSSLKPGMKVSYKVETPHKTRLNCKFEKGRLAVVGLEGPVNTEIVDGRVDISHVSKEVTAISGSADIDIDAVSAPVRASAGNGNIKISRAPIGSTAETESGDITLLVVGPAVASIKSGSGRITVGGAQGPLTLATQEGQIHVKANAYGNWQLKTLSGDLLVELPSKAQFNIDAVAKSGKIVVQRTDIASPVDGELHQQVNGGGKLIQLNTNGGRISIK